MPQLYQVIRQAPTLTELDGLGIQFLHLASIAQQFSQALNKGFIIQLIVILVYLFRMLCLSMIRTMKNMLEPSPDDSKAEVIIH